MSATKRFPTGYPGVFYREVRRLGKNGTEKVYYVVYKKDSKIFEEKVGRQYADNMTPAKASAIRSELLEGKRESRKVERDTAKANAEAARTKVTIGKIWELYQELNSQKKSLITDQYNFRNHLLGLAHKKPDELLTIDILKLRKSVEAKNLSPATVKHVLVLLRMLINWAVRQGVCPMIDPSKLHFDIPKLDNEKTEMLTHEQIQAYEAALAKEPDQNLAALFRLALVTGMRKSALLNLKWEDCDFKNHVIVLRGEVAKKGKTEFIPMNNAACTILQGIQRTESEYVFPGRDGGPRKAIRRMAQRLKKNAGLPEDFRPLHGLRHAYASFLVSSGRVPLYTVQKLLTHGSAKMTQRYAHLADEALREASSVADMIFVNRNSEVSNEEKDTGKE